MGRNLILLRLIQSVISLFVLASLCFFLLRAFPGSPFDDEVLLNPKVENNLKVFYGLDQPLSSQYITYIKNLFQGDLGLSMHFEGRSVASVISQGLPVTLQVGGLALFVSVFFGFWFGVLATRSPRLDQIHNAFVMITISLPTLMLGPLLIWFFAFKMNLLPAAMVTSLAGFVLPVLLLSLRPVAILSRVLKNSLSESLRSDYSRTARAMGLSPMRILIKWALKNSMIPFLSYLVVLVAGLLSGSLIIEMLFAIPGLGSQFLEALLNRDYPLVTGLALFYGFLLIVSQFFVDILNQVFDPRVKSL